MIACWLLVVLVAVAVRYPATFRQANESARENAALDLLDREVGGGNSVIPDQRILFEARGLIPEDGTLLEAFFRSARLQSLQAFDAWAFWVPKGQASSVAEARGAGLDAWLEVAPPG